MARAASEHFIELVEALQDLRREGIGLNGSVWVSLRPEEGDGRHLLRRPLCVSGRFVGSLSRSHCAAQ